MQYEVLRVPVGLMQSLYDVISTARHPNVEYGAIRKIEDQLSNVGRYTPEQVAKLDEFEAAEAMAAKKSARPTNVIPTDKS